MNFEKISFLFLILFCVGALSQPKCVSYTPISEGVLWNFNTTIGQSFQATMNATVLSVQFYRDNNVAFTFVATLNLCEDFNCSTELATTFASSSSQSIDITFSSVQLLAGENYVINLFDNSVSSSLKLNAANINGSMFVNGIRNDSVDLAYALCLDPGCFPCTTDSDCSDQGICVNISLPYRYCSCFSGFGGCNCGVRPNSQCSFQPVSDMTNYFEANVSLDYQYPKLVIGVSANLEENRFLSPAFNNTLNTPPYSEEVLMYFGSTASAFPECSFPTGFPYEIDWRDFAATSGDCTDKYLMNMTWSTAKNQCGFTSSDGSRTFTQTLTIQRYYLLESTGTRRVEQTKRILNVMYIFECYSAKYVRFPSEVQVSTSDVTISFPSAAASSAIVANDYDPYTELWKVVVQTTLASPYVLSLPTSTFATGSVADRLLNISLATMSGCTNQTTSVPCVQQLTFLFDKGTVADSCLGLLGTITSLVNVTCTTSACPSTAPVNLTMTLQTGNACPVTDQIDWSQATLSSYSDSTMTSLQTSFSINDVAYFGAVVETTEAVISSRTVEPGSVCFQSGSGACTPVAFTVLASTNGKDPVFSVNFRDSANFAFFTNSSQPTSFTVQATIQVLFLGNKSWKNKPSSQKATVAVTAVVDPNTEKENQKDESTDMSLPMMVAAGVAALIVVGGLVAVTMFFRKRRARRRESKMYLDSVYESCRVSQISTHEDRHT